MEVKAEAEGELTSVDWDLEKGASLVWTKGPQRGWRRFSREINASPTSLAQGLQGEPKSPRTFPQGPDKKPKLGRGNQA